jgi:hypothetical protein
MSASLAHLHTLAERTLDAHERRAGELRGRLAPILAAGAAGAFLLSPQALAAVHSGPASASVSFLLTLVAAVATALVIGQFLSRRLSLEQLLPSYFRRLLNACDALTDEALFHETMTSLFSDACEVAQAELDQLHRQFTAIMCGILFVLCGLALTAVVAW